jgi:hypothetical protein
VGSGQGKRVLLDTVARWNRDEGATRKSMSGVDSAHSRQFRGKSERCPLTSLDWRWVAVGLTVPTLVGMLIAFAVWRWGKNPTIGAILGALPIFIATVALIGREFIAIQRFYGECHALLEKHIVCRDLSPDDFTRFAIYCFIGMVEVFVLFYMSAVIDGHKREAEFALPWRG